MQKKSKHLFFHRAESGISAALNVDRTSPKSSIMLGPHSWSLTPHSVLLLAPPSVIADEHVQELNPTG